MSRAAMSRADFDRRRRRRSVVRVVIALSLGFIATISTAWICALRSPLRGGGPVAAAGVPAASVQGAQSLLPSYVFAMHGFGVRGTNFIETFSGLDSSGNFYTNRSPVDQHMAFGWPVPALSYRLVRSPTPPPSRLIAPTQIGMMEQQPYWLVGGLSGLNGASWRGLPERHLPLTPRFTGFVINTMLTSGVLYLLVGGWADIRAFARARRRRCEQCGYNARGLSRFPECGLETPCTLWVRIRDFISRGSIAQQRIPARERAPA